MRSGPLFVSTGLAMLSMRASSTLLLASLAAASCSPPSAYYVMPASLTQAVDGITSVQCYTSNGNVTVRAVEGVKEMTIDASISAKSESLPEVTAAVKGAKLECNVVGSRAKIDVVWPGDAESVQQTVHYELVVPAEWDVNLRSSNGNIETRGLTGDLKAQTSNGNLNVDGSSDEVELQSSNGKISAVLGGNGPVAGELKTGNGDIDVQLGDGRSVTIMAETSSGRASPAKRQLTVSSNSERKFEALQGAGAAILRLKSSNGNIKVR